MILALAVVMPLSFIIVSCDSTCDDNRNTLPLAGFYAMVEGKMQSVSVDSLQIVGLGAPGDSILSDMHSMASTVHLPFRIDQDETAYDFIARKDKNTSIHDKVIFRYSRVPQFVSQECGVSYRFNINQISWEGAFIDSVTCPKGYIDNHPLENIHIYFHVTK